MGAKTGISWTDATWNPLRGCSMVSEGCRNCYAMKVAARFSGKGQPYDGLAVMHPSLGARWTGEIMVVENMIDQPIRWRKPRMIFVNSMSDLFHEKVDKDTLVRIFDVMETANWHTFQVLTKRTERMREFCSSLVLSSGRDIGKNPLPNVWLGGSIEDEKAAKARFQDISKTPAAIRFWSAEPLIGEIDWKSYFSTDGSKNLDWIIFGGESQTGCRKMDIEWVRAGLQECEKNKIVPYVKQLGTIWASENGAKSRAGSDPLEWPTDLRIQEYPV